MKHVFKLFFGVLLAIALIGCATKANYEKIVQSWVGHHKDSLVSEWGPPAKSVSLSDGGEVLEYYKSSSGVVGTQSAYGTWFAIPYTDDCKTLFIANGTGTITSTKFKGSLCKAHAPTTQ